MRHPSTLTDKFRLLFLALLACAVPSARASFNATLQGQSFSNTTWIAGNLMGWKELDFIPCRVWFTNGPATNQTITIEFDHTKTSGSSTNPGIQGLFSFSNSPNVTITSGPTLTGNSGVDTWFYTLIVNFTSATSDGFVEFRARLAAGAHNFSGSSLALKGSLNGSPSPGVLQIAKPGPGSGNPDLAVTKTGATLVNPGDRF